MSTKEQAAAENAALRELLAAIAAAADVPLPADTHDDAMIGWYRAIGRRADFIALLAAIDPETSPASLHARAIALREVIDAPHPGHPPGRRDPMAIACPSCEAEPGQRCKSDFGCMARYYAAGVTS